MVEHTVSKNAIIAEGGYSPVFTGEHGRELLSALERFMTKAKRIDIMVAYVRESGVRLLLPALMAAARRGAVITLLTGRNFNLTEPQALYLFRYYLGDAVIVRFYQDIGRSFHPKAYFVHFDTYSYLFVGSSNLSASALGGAVEWNYCLDSRENEREYMAFYQTFQDICQNHSLLADDEVLQQYARNWRKPGNVSFDGQLKERQDTFQPRGAQIEALYYLAQTRAEGAEKALVHAATGIGKTYLAAFDSQSFATVLDFIGNYRNAGMVKGLLSREGQAVYGEGEPAENEYPDNCWVDFDLQLIDLFREVDKNRQSLRDVIKDEFYRIKSLLGKRPSRMELFENMTTSVYELCLKHAKENPFRHYLAYLVEMGEATPTEQELVGTIAEDFLQEIAATQMTKVYKMPVLLAMQEKNSLKAEL